MRLCFFLILVLSLPGLAQSIEPGKWKAKSIFEVNGIPLPSEDHVECISAAEAKDPKTTIVKALKRENCKLLSWKVITSKIDASLSCQNDQFDATGTLHGHFTSKSYSLSGEAEGIFQKMIPSTASLKLTGQWLGPCKK